MQDKYYRLRAAIEDLSLEKKSEDWHELNQGAYVNEGWNKANEEFQRRVEELLNKIENGI